MEEGKELCLVAVPVAFMKESSKTSWRKTGVGMGFQMLHKEYTEFRLL